MNLTNFLTTVVLLAAPVAHATDVFPVEISPFYRYANCDETSKQSQRSRALGGLTRRAQAQCKGPVVRKEPVTVSQEFCVEGYGYQFTISSVFACDAAGRTITGVGIAGFDEGYIGGAEDRALADAVRQCPGVDLFRYNDFTLDIASYGQMGGRVLAQTKFVCGTSSGN